MAHYVITIAREKGSGGYDIAKRLSDKLNIPFYDRKLLRIACAAAKRKGSEAVVLVGDPPYYGPLGFEKVAWNALAFPGPVDPARVLVMPFAEDTHERLKGVIAWRDSGAEGR